MQSRKCLTKFRFINTLESCMDCFAIPFAASLGSNIYMHVKTQTSRNKSVHKLSTGCVHTAYSKSLEEVWNKTVNNL